MKITNEQIGTIGTILCGLITLGISIWKMNNPAAEQTSETQKGE